MKGQKRTHGAKSLDDSIEDIIIENMNFGMRTTSSGIVLQADDGKDSGIRPRWALVHTVGPEQKDVKKGDWVLVEHGRWTRSWKMTNKDGVDRELRKADPAKVIAIWTGEGEPQDDAVGLL